MPMFSLGKPRWSISKAVVRGPSSIWLIISLAGERVLSTSNLAVTRGPSSISLGFISGEASQVLVLVWLAREASQSLVWRSREQGCSSCYCPIVSTPGSQKYPTRLSGWVVHNFSRPPSRHGVRHLPRPQPTDLAVWRSKWYKKRWCCSTLIY